MTKANLIRHIRNKGAVLARNVRPVYDIFGMDEFVRFKPFEPEYYILCGYIFGRPVLKRIRKNAIPKS